MNSAPLPVDRSVGAAGDRRRTYLLVILALTALGMAMAAFAYWPGVMIDDARWQYQQSVDNAYEDWHPPLMAWIWHYLMLLEPGPGPMLLLQLSLYWVGIALVAAWLYRRDNPRLGIAAALVGWLPAPLALMGSVTKDCLMAGALSCAVGCLLWSRTASRPAARATLGAAAMIALLFGAALRVNAFLACVPLALAVLPARFTCNAPRFALTAIASAAIFFLIPGAIASALQAEDTDSQLSLIIFDLGGITERTKVNQFPDLGVANPVAVNHLCYDPYQWDSYSTWAQKPCPLGFGPFQSLVDEGDIDPRMIWIRAIAAHPVAYAQHRFAHFNRATWFIVPENPDPPAWTKSVPNPWNFQVRPNWLLSCVDAVANAASRTPLGWPMFWIAVALTVLILCCAARLSGEIAAIAASSFCYGIGYLIVGVATGMRYHVWTMIAAALASVLAAAELSVGANRLSSRARALAAATIGVPTLLTAFARLAL